MSAVDLGAFGGELIALQGFDRHLGLELRLDLAPSGCTAGLLYASVPKP